MEDCKALRLRLACNLLSAGAFNPVVIGKHQLKFSLQQRVQIPGWPISAANLLIPWALPICSWPGISQSDCSKAAMCITFSVPRAGVCFFATPQKDRKLKRYQNNDDPMSYGGITLQFSCHSRYRLYLSYAIHPSLRISLQVLGSILEVISFKRSPTLRHYPYF